MKYRSFIILIALWFISYTAQGIIYRHDVAADAYRKLAGDSSFNCVGIIYKKLGDSLAVAASCVLVGDRYVLTARHTFEAGNKLDVASYKIGFRDSVYDIATYSDYSEEHDMLLLVPDRAVLHITPARLNTERTEAGAVAVMVGYGGLRPADKLDGNIGVGVCYAGQNIIDSTGGVMINGQYARLYADFADSGRQGGNAALPLESMLNGGDSGGGLFIQRNGSYVLAGIASGSRFVVSSGSGFYGSSMYWCRVAAYISWVEETMAGEVIPKSPSQ